MTFQETAKIMAVFKAAYPRYYANIDVEEARRVTDYEIGDNVEILDPSFRGMIGRVSAIDMEKGKVTVMLSLFGGRETPVDLEYDQVFKV